MGSEYNDVDSTSILAGLDVRKNILETIKDMIIKLIKFGIHGKHMYICIHTHR